MPANDWRKIPIASTLATQKHTHYVRCSLVKVSSTPGTQTRNSTFSISAAHRHHHHHRRCRHDTNTNKPVVRVWNYYDSLSSHLDTASWCVDTHPALIGGYLDPPAGVGCQQSQMGMAALGTTVFEPGAFHSPTYLQQDLTRSLHSCSTQRAQSCDDKFNTAQSE